MTLADALVELQELTERLRRECPWDREQTERTIVPHTVEEAYEVADAALRGDDAKLLDEIGDLLFQCVFLALTLQENASGDLEQAVRLVTAKLIRRHPHVFAGTSLEGKDLLVQWEQIKREEKGDPGRSILDGVPRSLPALFAAERLQERAARVKLRPPRIELPLDIDDPEFLGELLFGVVAEARERGFDAETALREANERFTAHVGRVEQRATADGRELESYTDAELRGLWEATGGEVQTA